MSVVPWQVTYSVQLKSHGEVTHGFMVVDNSVDIILLIKKWAGMHSLTMNEKVF